VTIEATCPRETHPDELLPDELALDFECVEDALAAGLALPCQDHDPDLFFADSPVEVERAKTLCTDCPVKALCLAAALERREPWGVWGGEWFEAGEAVARKRPRGRPRKDGSIGPRPAPVRVSPRTKEVAA
jgi:WhiB family redox-sensing transcriptional regulator